MSFTELNGIDEAISRPKPTPKEKAPAGFECAGARLLMLIACWDCQPEKTNTPSPFCLWHDRHCSK